MKYVLVDKGDNIIDKVELNSELREAKKFFIGRKQIDDFLPIIFVDLVLRELLK